MAETFICNGEQVHFTNGGCHELYLIWSSCAMQLNYTELSENLKEQTNLGWGCAADGIDGEYLSDEFSSKNTKMQFLEVMDMLIEEIADNKSIAREMDVNWDDRLREYWLEKLNKLRAALYVQVIV